MSCRGRHPFACSAGDLERAAPPRETRETTLMGPSAGTIPASPFWVSACSGPPVCYCSRGLECLAGKCRFQDQGLGKGRLPRFPRLPPLSGCRAEPLLEATVAKRAKAAHPKVLIVSTLARPSFFRSPCIGGQNLSLEPVPPCLQWVMPILKGIGNTLLCSRFDYGKRISTRAKSVNSEHRHEPLALREQPGKDYGS